jgi:S-adenosylmethionine:tRNA ribosyltransferase-isomerase
MVKPGKYARKGDKLIFGDGRLAAYVEEITESGLRIVRFDYQYQTDSQTETTFQFQKQNQAKNHIQANDKILSQIQNQTQISPQNQDLVDVQGKFQNPIQNQTQYQDKIQDQVINKTKAQAHDKNHTQTDIETLLYEIGVPPLPHYIKPRADHSFDKDRYQTVYAEHNGSVAAPTAGLHFTNEILGEFQTAGINIARLTLHVGLGTFRPVKMENIEDHKMHSEYYRIAADQAEIINNAKRNKKRIIAVGTTSCRTVETAADEKGCLRPGEGKTDIFIYPGYRFRAVNALLTNFHLPESTLIMLVSAFAGRDNIFKAYKTAVDNEFRFFSYGDCMLIV